MINSFDTLRSRVNNIIKVIPNNSPEKTQAADVKQYLLDEIDSVEDLVKQLGLSITGTLKTYAKTSEVFNGDYTSLINRPTIPTYDLSVYALKTDIFSKKYSDLTGLPTLFDGTWSSLSNKPNLFSGNYVDLVNKPNLVTSYSQLSDKPNIPVYDLSLYRLKSDTIDYTTLVNKPVVSKLLWNQLSTTPVTNTTNETNILVTGNGSVMIDANPTIGTAFRLTGRGLFSTQSITTPTLVVKIWMGSVVIASGTVSSLLLGANNKTLSFTVDIVVKATNTVYAQGGFNYYGTATDALSSTPLLNGIGSDTVVDLTTSNQVRMTVAWSSASTSNQILIKIVNLEKLN